MVTPACRHAHDVSPEQSKEFGPEAPQLYGAPCFDSAAFTAADAELRVVDDDEPDEDDELEEDEDDEDELDEDELEELDELDELPAASRSAAA
jgi:hypothetical protein